MRLVVTTSLCVLASTLVSIVYRLFRDCGNDIARVRVDTECQFRITNDMVRVRVGSKEKTDVRLAIATTDHAYRHKYAVHETRSHLINVHKSGLCMRPRSSRFLSRCTDDTSFHLPERRQLAGRTQTVVDFVRRPHSVAVTYTV